MIMEKDEEPFIEESSKLISRFLYGEEPWNKLTIDLDAIRSNYLKIKSKLKNPDKIYCVIKADAYGHGIKRTAQALMDEGCLAFAVESPNEAISVRKIGFDGKILLLNPVPDWMIELCLFMDIDLTVVSFSKLTVINDIAKKLGIKSRIHLKVNVGLNRMGISQSWMKKMSMKLYELDNIVFKGLYAIARDNVSSLDGYQQLLEIHEKLSDINIRPNEVHYANSTTFLTSPETLESGVRIGILNYGVVPPEQAKEGQTNPYIPAMSLKTKIVQIRELKKGNYIGYRSKSPLKEDKIIGTLPIGYSHGIDRKLAKNNGEVLINGKRVPFIGAISMNSSTVDLTSAGKVDIGNEVVILGSQGNEHIDANEMAAKTDTIAAEVLVKLGKSISRRYIDKSISYKEIEHIIDNQKFQFILIKNKDELPETFTIKDVLDFMKENQSSEHKSNLVEQSIIDLLLSTDENLEGYVCVVYSSEKIYGISVLISSSLETAICSLELIYFCVAKDKRQKGIGSRMLEFLSESLYSIFTLYLKKSHLHSAFFEKRMEKNVCLKLFTKKGYSNERIKT